jgi:hypothetical protein
VRNRIEEVFGWTKATAAFADASPWSGLHRLDVTLTATAYNFVRLQVRLPLERVSLFTDADKRRPYREREIPGPAEEDNLCA